MVELTPVQMQTLERLFEAGFRPIAIPPYESALCVRRGECAAVLSPIPNGGLKLLASPSYLIDGNLSVKLRRSSGDVFVWKKTELAATPERLQELESFRRELTEISGNAASAVITIDLQFSQSPGKLKFPWRPTTLFALVQGLPGWRAPSKRSAQA